MCKSTMLNKLLKFKRTNFVELKNEVIKCDLTGTQAIGYDKYHEILAEIYYISKELGLEV